MNYLNEEIEKYRNLPVVINGKLSELPLTDETIKEHKENLAKKFYQNMREYLKPELAKYENLEVIYHN